MHATDIAEIKAQKSRKPRTEAQRQRRRERRAALRPTPLKSAPVLTREEAAERKRELNKIWAKKDYDRRRRAKATYDKTIPTGFCSCPHCFSRILVYGDKQKIIRASKETTRIGIVIEHSGVKVSVPEIERRPCATCIRDLWHFKQYGKYPKGSIFWELKLFDKGLR